MTQHWPDPHEFWRGKRVLVTGGAGFLGSVVVETLRQRTETSFGFRASTPFDEGLADTVSWYETARNGAKQSVA